MDVYMNFFFFFFLALYVNFFYTNTTILFRVNCTDPFLDLFLLYMILFHFFTYYCDPSKWERCNAFTPKREVNATKAQKLRNYL